MTSKKESWASLAGKKEAYRLLILKHAPSVAAVAYAFVSDSKVALTITEETFVQAYVHLAALKDEAQFVRMLSRLARQLARQYARLTRKTARAAGEGQPPVTGEVSAAVASLPERHRVILNCRYLRAMSYEEIAALLGGDAESVSARLVEAVRALSVKLARKYAWEVERP